MLKKESSFFIEKRPLESVYIGGGTPSLLSPPAISFLIDSIRKEFSPVKDIEITLEANPDTIDFEKLKGFKEAGINRLSIGLQSANDKDLKALGRPHSAAKGLKAFEEARKAGFENIGLDLIFGVPGQSLADWEHSVKKVIELRPEHISMYGLTIEEGTPFHDMQQKGALALPGEEAEVEMFRLGIELFKAGGWHHYEISNLGLPGFYSRHNNRYWLGKDYLGLGVSAHSYLSRPDWGRRWWNELAPSSYMARIEEQGIAIAGCEDLSRDDAVNEALILGLRMLERGINGEDFRRKFGVYPKEVFRNWAELEEKGFVRSSGQDLLLTSEGVLVANEILLRI